VTVLVFIIVFVRFIQMPAVLVLGAWFLLQLLSGATTTSESGGVAFLAHVGGFVTGMVLIPFFKDRNVALFGGPYSRSFQVSRPRDMRRGGGSVPSAGMFRRGPRGPWG
jgi:hypothetical protein